MKFLGKNNRFSDTLCAKAEHAKKQHSAVTNGFMGPPDRVSVLERQFRRRIREWGDWISPDARILAL
jgi:hypothetical protein